MDIDWSKAPEDATHWVGGTYPWHRRIDGRVAYWVRGDVWRVMHTSLAELEEFHASSIQARPVAPWNGDGLPPVGTVCEYREEKSSPVAWQKVEVAYRSQWSIVLREVDQDGPDDPVDIAYNDPENLLFRPIRTAEQIEADEREKTIQQFCQELDVPHAIGSRAYDAGYRKVQP